MIRMLAITALIALCISVPLLADVSGGLTSYRVSMILYPGDDPAAVAKRLAAMYRGALETPVDANGTFTISVSDAGAGLMGRDPAVARMEIASAEAPRPDRAVSGEEVATNATTDWTLGPYEYDGAGNIKKIGTDFFVYDTRGRLLVSADAQPGVPVVHKQTYTYDTFGNLLTIETAGRGKTTLSIAGVTNRLSSVSDGSTARTITYDSRGNFVADGDATYEYDALNVMRKSTVGGVTRSYVYTANDERIGTIEQTGTGTRSEWTIRNTAGQVLRRYSQESTGEWKWEEDYIYRGAQMLAAEVATPAKTLHFHLDHLGTPRLITGNGGVEISRQNYHPFGEEISPLQGEREKKQFTGHERDAESLDYMHARFYGPFVGRFLSVDPGRDWDVRQPQSWNMYAYVRNNPINNTDPDGKWCVPCLAPLIPVAIRAAPAIQRAAQRAYIYLSNPANVQRVINTGQSVVAVGVTLMESATKPGSANGDTAGKRFPTAVQEQAADEARGADGQTRCQNCGVPTSEPGVEPAEGEIKGNTDHIIPSSKGGNATPDNAQHTCETCNKSAGANPKPKKTGAEKLRDKELNQQ